jgi:cysteine desulfurase
MVERLQKLLRPDTRFVALMLANNETGVLQPVAEAVALCHQAGVPLHVDAVQAAGKLEIDFRALGAATMSLAAHKFNGPVGIGALAVRHGVALAPRLFGGVQEEGLRPGTQAVALAVGMHAALAEWHAELGARRARLLALRERFEALLREGVPELVVHGAGAARLPHTSCVALPGVERQAMHMALDRAGVAASTGSACASGASQPSPVLRAMGVPEAVVSASLRFSLGPTNTEEEVHEACRLILLLYKELRSSSQAVKSSLGHRIAVGKTV